MRLKRSITLLILSLLPFMMSATAGVSETARQQARAVRVEISDEQPRLFIVQLIDPPALVAHGRSRTNDSVNETERFNPDDESVQRYISQLENTQDDLLLTHNLWHKRIYSYSYTFNGFAAMLTPSEANQLRISKGVRKVWEDTRRQVATSTTPGYLGLLNNEGGLRSDLGLTGEDIIIGVIDSGIAPDHPSFSDRKVREQPRLCRSNWAEESLLGIWLCRRYQERDGDIWYDAAPVHWRGECETGPGFTIEACNNKLIGARFYRSGFADDEFDEGEFLSPMDADGHGTHIASIAAGNKVAASVFGNSVGTISGIAPRARIAVYKACWLEPGATRATCSVADLQMAIEDAVADGVDVINYSIGDANNSIDDPDDLELLAAAEAGVVSVVATGNDGPDISTIQSPATTPWSISTGAATKPGNRVTEALRINTPESLINDYESIEAETQFTPRLSERGPITGTLIAANDASTVTPTDDEVGSLYDACSPISNSSELSGNIALIQRGYCNFDVKIANAESAGAIAVVVYTNDQALLKMDGNANVVDIPAIMIGQADGNLILEKLLDAAVVNVTLDKSLLTTINDKGNEVATFSGRGPNLGDTDFLKPDLLAPGLAILGAQTPAVANGFKGEQFQYLSGTSQAAPHISGIAALLKQAHPDWSPAEIKSALMTSARQNITKANDEQANAFDMGAGHVVPNNAADPGLLFPVDYREYDAYLCTIGLARISQDECEQLAEMNFQQDARDINLPSVAISQLTSTVTVTRRVRNPGPTAKFTLETVVPEGIELKVTPDSLTLATDESREYTLRFTTDGSGLGQWHFGSVTWTNENHRVYSPFVVQPALFSSPLYAYGEGASGDISLPISMGFSGDYSAKLNGLFLPCVLPDNNKDDGEVCTNTEAAEVEDANGVPYAFTNTPPSSVRRFLITVPDTDDRLLRIALFDELTDGAHDLDVYLHYCGVGVLPQFCSVNPNNVLSSTTPYSSNELIDVNAPDPGTWVVDVHGYSTEDAQTARFRVFTWSFGSNSDANNLTLSNLPGAAVAGTTSTINARWDNLPAGLWLGDISHYGNANTLLETTLIEIDNGAFAEYD